MNLSQMSHPHLLFSCSSVTYLWHVYLFILVQCSEVQITGMIALVMVLQLDDLLNDGHRGLYPLAMMIT